MQRIFMPAIALLNRLSYTMKFTLLWLISLIAICVVAYSLFVELENDIQPSQRRLQGLALIDPVTRAMQALQLHRGLSAALLRGNQAMGEKRASQDKAVSDALRHLEAKLPPKISTSKDFRHIQTEWLRLQKEGLQWTVVENLAAHTALIEHFQFLEQLLSEEHLLILDGDIATYYLIDITTNRLTHVLEKLGRLRAYGTGVLIKKQLSEAQRVELLVMIDELKDVLRHFDLSLESVLRHDPAIHEALLNVARNIDQSAAMVIDLLRTDILSGRFSIAPEAFMNIATEQIDQSYAQLYGALLPLAGRLTQEHIDLTRHDLYTTVGISLLLFLLAVYMSVGMYYAIVGSIQSLASSARAFANGDLSKRIHLDTHDEISLIGDSFNEMADGFNAMLKMHREDEVRLRTTIETAMDAVVQMDSKGIIIGWNHQAEKIFGWSSEEAVGRMLAETIIPLQHREEHMKGIARFLSSGQSSILNSRMKFNGLHRDGHEFPIELSITAINTAGKYEFNGFIRDITAQKVSEELIWRQANFDALTSLPNRNMFYDRLDQDIKKAHRAGLKTALLFIDLDKFKEVNDTLGHNKGDILLKEAARRIAGCVRETDTVARLGGDEFTVILAELDDAASVERIAGNILQSLAKPFRLDNDEAYISASIGITLHPMDAANVEDLIKNADQAMYAAKNEGRNRFNYFTQSMQQAMLARMHLTKELHGALKSDQFMVYYQPIVELATGHINKAEALIRWQHPEIGMINPVKFIPLAEDSGLIAEIGDWIFKKAALQAKRWTSLYKSDFQISVNVSPAQLRGNDSQCSTWFDYLHELGLQGQSMVIEVTEGLLLDAGKNNSNKLLDFRDAGIQVAIDDFGTGYSSLSYLKKFDIDYLKIDQSFVRDLETDPDDMALSEAIIVMAHKLGLKVVAEGVESEAQHRHLKAMGCDYAQGYLFSRPVTVEEFEELLRIRQQEIKRYEI